METKLKKYFISIFQENLNIIYQKIFLTFIVVGHMTKKMFSSYILGVKSISNQASWLFSQIGPQLLKEWLLFVHKNIS